ncbi:hypothetical protein EJ06DRAFT_251838 [Trichodelitschia bisporula]|uniref:Uncharacterized protein n=1 Tax=Trichodelitschia bisporula TaxID=703511 RepID=A0A6G1HIU3_9PEZI|nr:hypothetical protein EJ06DRAFT_251838 [Trichodelitschia bisporula]
MTRNGSGKCPACRHAVNSCPRRPDIRVLHALRALLGIWSGPGAFPLGERLIVDSTSSLVISFFISWRTDGIRACGMSERSALTGGGGAYRLGYLPSLRCPLPTGHLYPRGGLAVVGRVGVCRLACVTTLRSSRGSRCGGHRDFAFRGGEIGAMSWSYRGESCA